MTNDALPPNAAPGLQRLRGWAGRHPGRSAALLLLLGFGLYLFADEPTSMDYDAGFYWALAGSYWQHGHFELLAFDNNLRGYLFPLLLSPLARLATEHGLVPMTLARLLGMGLAATLFGVVAPGLWRAVQSLGRAEVAPVSLGRRLAFGALGFVFWRGYFHFTLSDFPALLALSGALWTALRGRPVTGSLLAGALAAAAANFRPIYLAALPLLGVLYLWPGATAASRAPRWPGRWGGRLAFAAGIALALAPQSAINRAHFGSASPLVLTSKPDEPSLYLMQLQGGLQFQKYETNVGLDYPKPTMFFVDRQGEWLWLSTGLAQLRDYGQYVPIVRRSPLVVAGVYLRHLFNGLDLQYPTAYVTEVYAATWPLALLNYTVLLGGLAVLARRLRHRPPRPWLRGWVLLTLLGPCAATLPVIMECRFLLPLHLFLCAMLAFGLPAWREWRRPSLGVGLAAGLAYALLVAACFRTSMDAQLALTPGPRTVFPWQRPSPQPW